MTILLADGRYRHYELKRQNETDVVVVPIIIMMLPRWLRGRYP